SGAVRRAPANRSDRARLLRLRRARRIAVEATVVAVAVVALLVLDAGAGFDGSAPNPLLLVAPLLVAAAATLVVLRVVPPVVRGGVVVARRAHGVSGVLVAARAGRARAALPLLALCIALGLALNDGMLLASVAAGQEAAAWDRIGADARATTAADVQRLRAEPGVRHAAVVAVEPGTSLDLGTTGARATLLGVDPGYAGVVGALPASAQDTAAVLRRLGDPSGPLPVVVDEQLAGLMAGRALTLQLDAGDVPARVAGTVAGGPAGWADGPFLFADLDALRRRAPDVQADAALVVGPAAGAALVAAGVPEDDVLTRTGWLRALRDAPIVAGTRRATLLAAGLLALLAGAALAATVLAGAPDRRRTLALLRTLGMRRRVGWWLLVADLVPLVLGGLAGGAAIGVVAAEVFDPALALSGLTGGRGDPPVGISGAVLGVVLAGALVVLAAGVGVEALSWRRDRFAEVLRVGGR
ncbi:FtsX-like permease family protein, partial [Amnibacterium endophyticum]